MSLLPFNLHTSPNIEKVMMSDLCSEQYCSLKRIIQIIYLSSDHSKWDPTSTYEEILSCHTGLKAEVVLLVSVPVHKEIILFTMQFKKYFELIMQPSKILKSCV